MTRVAVVTGAARGIEFSQHRLTERLLAPEEVAPAVVWLCGEPASAVAGTVVRADGGFTV
ncbi:MAG TPA: SDR family oxidoreductase [Amycolatopsis sp.]|nr:SDR family oxidoreductase [Amycolatopsis sp.]